MSGNEEKLYRLCDEASSRFKLVSTSGNKKFKYCPNWLNKKSILFQNENNGKLRDTYYYYKRGSIIMVDFGVNLGSEFSGNHFAVVLNKKDTIHNKTLTVIPLTSKDGNKRLPLGSKLFEEVTKNLNKKVEDLYSRAKEIEAMRKNTHSLRNAANQIILNLTGKSTEELLEIESNRIQLKIEDDDDVNSSLSNLDEIANKLKADMKILESDAKEVRKDVKLLRTVIESYEKYNKNTFARVSDITTISKEKIRYINKFDPSGKIKFDKSVMTNLSEQIKALYLS